MSLDQDDNILVGAGTGGSTQGANVATDYNSTSASHYQLFKQSFGKDGDFIAVGDGADAGSRPLPTKLFQDNGTALSAETLTAGLSVLNVNLRGTSGSGNVPVDINAMNLGEIRIAGTAGGVPVGVCGDNFHIRTLFGATAGNTLTSIFSHGGDFDSVSIQGISGAFPVGITATNLHVRPLTSTDQITIAGGTVDAVLSAGITINAGGSLEILSASGVTGFGTGTAPALKDAPGVTKGLPILLYGNSGGTAAAVGMSGDALKVALSQTLTAQGTFTATVDNPKAAGYTTGNSAVTATPNLHDGDVLGNTLGFPALMYGSCGGTAVGIAVSGGALVTVLKGSLSASISDVNVDVPKAMGYTTGAGGVTGNINRLLANGDVTGNTMATPVLLYGASGNTAVGIGITMAGAEQALLVAGVMGVTNVPGHALEVTSGANPISTKVTSLPNVTIGTVTPTVTVNHGNGGVTVAGGTLAGILGTVTVSPGAGFSLAGGNLDSVVAFGGVTGFGTGGSPSIFNQPGGKTGGLPVFLYGLSGAGGTAAAVGMSGDGIKVFHESPLPISSVAGQVTAVGGVTGMGSSLDVGPGPLGGDGITVSGGLPVLLYGRSGGSQTPVSVGMSADGIKVSVIDGVNVDVSGIEIPSTVSVQNATSTRLAVGLSGDTLVPAGATFHDGTVLSVNTHVFGLTGGRNNAFGLTAGGTYGSSIMVHGISGPTGDTFVNDRELREVFTAGDGFTNDFLSAFYDREDTPGDRGDSVWDKVDSILRELEGTISVTVPTGFVTTSDFNRAFGSTTLVSLPGSLAFDGDTAPKTLMNVDVNSIKLPTVGTASGNTAGLLPDIGSGNEENAVQLPAHNLTKGINIKNTSGTGIIHIGFSEASIDSGANGGYELLPREEVFIETRNLSNLWVASCPGASGCYIGG